MNSLRSTDVRITFRKEFSTSKGVYEMKKTKVAALLLVGALAAAGLSGCGSTETTMEDTTVQTKTEAPEQMQQKAMAKVVSLDGDTLTVVLGTMPEGGVDGNENRNGTPSDQVDSSTDGSSSQTGEAQNGGTPPSGDQNGGTPPSDGQKGGPQGDGQQGGTPPTSEDGTMGEGGHQGGGQIIFGTDEVTYTLSASVIVTSGQGDNETEIDLSEIATDDIIVFTTSTDSDGHEVIDTIRIME